MIAAGSIFLVLMVISMVIFRRDVGAQIKERLASEGYRVHPVDSFDAVEILSGWEVEIYHDTTWKVEVEGVLESVNESIAEGDGFLRFGNLMTNNRGLHVRAKIAAPSLRYISADSGAVVHINGFRSDSVEFTLTEGGRIDGRDNLFNIMQVRSAVPLDFTLKDSID